MKAYLEAMRGEGITEEDFTWMREIRLALESGEAVYYISAEDSSCCMYSSLDDDSESTNSFPPGPPATANNAVEAPMKLPPPTRGNRMMVALATLDTASL